MNEIALHKMQEDEGYGSFLIQAIANLYNCKPEISLIEKMVYEYTDCGAWIKFDSEGVLIGTIVEGSDAEISIRIDLNGITTDISEEEGAALLQKRFFDALDECENFATEQFQNG